MSRRLTPGKHRKVTAPLILVVTMSMVVEWIVLVAGVKPHEMMVGVLSVIACGAFLLVAHRSCALQLEVKLADLAQAWRIPWYMLTDTYAITAVLIKDLTGAGRADSLYRVCGYKAAKRDSRLAARGVLETLYSTVTPNSIVLGIDPGQSRMLFHQLKRTSMTKMAKDLGALQ